MQDIRSILVVLDPLADEQPALRRACLIARSTGSELHLLDSGIQADARDRADHRDAGIQLLCHARNQQIRCALGDMQLLWWHAELLAELDAGLMVVRQHRTAQRKGRIAV